MRVFRDSLEAIRSITQLAGSRVCKEECKAKAAGAKKFTFARQGMGFSTGRRAEPVAGERKGFTQNRQRGIAGVDVAVEAEIGPRCGSSRARSGNREQKTEEKECC